jgi:hypothetical protein
MDAAKVWAVVSAAASVTKGRLRTPKRYSPAVRRLRRR